MGPWFAEFKIVKWYRSCSWLKRRIILVIGTLGVGWIITALVIYGTIAAGITKWDDVIIGALVAWTGELIFFSILGGVVSVLTLRDPRQEVFDDRIRILFGADKVPDAVLNYNRRMLSRLAGYAQSANRSVTIEEYSPEFKAYRVRVKTEYFYKNLLPDVEYDETLPWHFTPDKFPANGPPELGKILSIRVEGEETIKKPILVEPEGFRAELRLKMKPKGSAHFAFEYWTWMAVDQPQTMHPRRLVEQFEMLVVNQCDHNPRMNLDGKDEGTINLVYNQAFAFEPVQSVVPGEKIFTFLLLSPS